MFTTKITLSFSYEEETSDTTTWEHAWGLEASACGSFEESIIFESGKETIGGKVSYNGKYGTSHTVSDKITVSDTETIQCDPNTTCLLNLKANHLNNQKIPFTAKVRRTVGSYSTTYDTTGN